MATITLTIYDPDGHEFEMEYYSRFDADAEWCDFCGERIESGWQDAEIAGICSLTLCDNCAKANAAAPARAYGVTRAGVVEHDAADFPFD